MTITRLPYPVLTDVAHDSQANFEVIDGHLDGLGGSTASQTAELAAHALELADHATQLSQLTGVRTRFVIGSGAPASTPTQTTFYFRTDTPSVAGQRIYVFDPVGVVWNSLV